MRDALTQEEAECDARTVRVFVVESAGGARCERGIDDRTGDVHLARCLGRNEQCQTARRGAELPAQTMVGRAHRQQPFRQAQCRLMHEVIMATRARRSGQCDIAGSTMRVRKLPRLVSAPDATR